jgi:hypothetical protein
LNQLGWVTSYAAPSRYRPWNEATSAHDIAWLKAEALRRGRGEPEWLLANDDGEPMDESRVCKVFKMR